MARTPSDWSNVAFNQVPHSSNQIHSDQLARDYGFKGGLVPGVTLSAYLAHPAVEAWGKDWLESGYIHVKVELPVYDGKRFFIETDGDECSYTADLISEGRRCAMAHVRLGEDHRFFKEIPKRQGHSILSKDYEPLPANPENMLSLKEKGCLAAQFAWSSEHEMASYLEDDDCMPHLLKAVALEQMHEHFESGFANLSFLLGCANRHFAAVASMNPWVHLETRSQNYKAVALGETLISEMKIIDLFERKEHQFADCTFNLFNAKTNECVCSIWQRAIYQLKEK